MNRDEAWTLVSSKVKNRNLQKHMLATEACLRALARRLDGDEEQWGLAGLLHDVDYEETKDDTSRHGIVAGEILEEQGVDPAIIHAVKAHTEQAPLESTLDRAIWAVDPLTGLIVSATLMHPDRKLAAVDVPFILRRYGERRFSAAVSREQIASCKDLGLELEEFIGICLTAMQGIADDLGL